MIIIKLKELSSSVTAMGNIFVSQEIIEIKDIGQKAIDIMNEVLKNITSLKEMVEEVRNDDEMQKILDTQGQQRVQLQEIQPEQQEKKLLLEELQEAYIKINQYMQKALRYMCMHVQDVTQQLQETKNQMHVILEIGQYEHEEHPENELREVLGRLKTQLLRTLRSLDTLSIFQLVERIDNEMFHYMNLPFIEQKTLKFNVITILRKSAQVRQKHEHIMRGKIQQKMQKLQEKAKKVERNETMLQTFDQQYVKYIQEQMEWIQKKAKLIENQATKAWDEYYMKLACLAALRSKDPSTPVS